MVFAVSPMNTPGDYVHPLARDFADFLRLLLACGDAAALEQVHGWSEEQFDAFLRDNPHTYEQQTVLNQIGSTLSLAPMEQPFTHLKELQAEFDYNSIPFTADYYDLVPVEMPEPKLPPWKVTFNGSFWGEHGRERAGKEILLNKQFAWGMRFDIFRLSMYATRV